MFRYSIKISGIVQGIGYRYFVSNRAKKLDITGWVKNLDTGEVEINAEGTDDKLEIFVHVIKTNHPWAQIKNVEIIKFEIQERLSDNFVVTV